MGIYNDDGFSRMSWDSIEENERHKLKEEEVWIVMFWNDPDFKFGKVCSTEDIAKRELKIVQDKEIITNWKNCWYYEKFNVVTE